MTTGPAVFNKVRLSVAVGTILAATVATVTCGGPTGPSGSALTLVGLTIQPNTADLHVGTVLMLNAVGRYSDGHTAPVAAAWTSDNASVASVDSSGDLTATRIGRAAITAMSADVTTSVEFVVTPVDAAPWSGDFNGTWSGTSLELKCTWLGGPGPSPCEGQYNGGLGLPTTLVIQQHTNTVTCQVTIGGINKFTGNLTGWVDERAHLYLVGQISGEEVGVSRFDDADFSVSQTGKLVGTYSWTNMFRNAFGDQKLRQDWRLLDLTRTP